VQLPVGVANRVSVIIEIERVFLSLSYRFGAAWAFAVVNGYSAQVLDNTCRREIWE